MVPWEKTLPSHRCKKMTIVEVYLTKSTSVNTEFRDFQKENEILANVDSIAVSLSTAIGGRQCYLCQCRERERDQQRNELELFSSANEDKNESLLTRSEEYLIELTLRRVKNILVTEKETSSQAPRCAS